MNTEDLNLVNTEVSQESFQLDYSHPQFQSISIIGEFKWLEVDFSHDAGDYYTPPTSDVDIDFMINMKTVEVYDQDGDEIKGIGKDVIDLIEEHITDYVYDNAEDFNQ